MRVQAETAPKTPLGIKAFDEAAGVTGILNGTEPVIFVYHAVQGIIDADGTPTAQVRLRGWPYDTGPQDITFAPPMEKRSFATLKPPPWDVLKANDVVRRAEKSRSWWLRAMPRATITGTAAMSIRRTRSSRREFLISPALRYGRLPAAMNLR